MIGSRTVTALVFLVASLGASIVLWWYFDTLLFFLLVPFVPILFRGLGSDGTSEPQVKSCPQCGFQSINEEYEYCPRDGRRLVQRENHREQQGNTDRW